MERLSMPSSGELATRRNERRLSYRARRLAAADALPPRKENAECCAALVDRLGRLRPGFCSPQCIRRPENWALIRAGRPVPRGGAIKRHPASSGYWPHDPERKETA